MGKVVVGWREWASLPELGIDAIKMKVDTGARTSAIHAFEVESFERDGREWVRFSLHPIQDQPQVIVCEAPVLDRRVVTDSGGHKEERPVILTSIDLGGRRWSIEITLTDRENMKFRMLLGRTAMTEIVVEPTESFLLGGDRDNP
ncbi:ATP-dependent zinc protease [Alcanivorax sp. S6407]|uniref:ATP-dependent zinc protease family protein n=1 Tax=Alcanivorax sp. S6407 TaxID=2926424 RepID=UPI001FF66FDE|nr:ATP-dependent zinc protease [Alcanivorax sp. S6407]MCK0155192.1 ATP-dependent zinc protease [Alcanivorax sp. S6407]